jgi:hypothetical protein
LICAAKVKFLIDNWKWIMDNFDAACLPQAGMLDA